LDAAAAADPGRTRRGRAARCRECRAQGAASGGWAAARHGAREGCRASRVPAAPPRISSADLFSSLTRSDPVYDRWPRRRTMARAKKKSKASRASSAKKTKRTAARKGASRKTAARKTARKGAAKKTAKKKSAKRAAGGAMRAAGGAKRSTGGRKSSAARRAPAAAPGAAPTHGGGMGAEGGAEMEHLGSDELIDEDADIDLGSDEGGGDDDLEGM